MLGVEGTRCTEDHPTPDGAPWDMSPTVEAILTRDRRVATAALAAVTLSAWAYTFAMQRTGMAGDGAMSPLMVMPVHWSLSYAAVVLIMWWVMMAAMMLPSAAPLILLFAAVQRKQREANNPFVPTGLLVAGYLAVWAGFSVVATGLQWTLDQGALLTMSLSVASRVLGATVLIAAGLYQFTPVKGACLRHCRSPFTFVTTHWRPGPGGAFRMGLAHGVFCLGCCWVLMSLLFVGGVMNLVWIGGLALYVLLEKLMPRGHWVRYASGGLLTAWGLGIAGGLL
jgi:predicted metal-binding membrane protein